MHWLLAFAFESGLRRSSLLMLPRDMLNYRPRWRLVFANSAAKPHARSLAVW